jgi:hypothetical protein
MVEIYVLFDLLKANNVNKEKIFEGGTTAGRKPA